MPDRSTPANEASLKARWAREVRTRLSSLRLSAVREAEIVDELSQHLADHYRELVAGGASSEEATRSTLAEFSQRERAGGAYGATAASTGDCVYHTCRARRIVSRVGRPGFLRELEQAVWSVNPNLPLASIQTLEEIERKSMAQTSLRW